MIRLSHASIRSRVLRLAKVLLMKARKLSPIPILSSITIVGGRGTDRMPLSSRPNSGIETVMRRAAANTKFRDALLKTPHEAIRRSKVPLTKNEKALLLQVAPEKLEKMLAGYRPLVKEAGTIRTFVAWIIVVLVWLILLLFGFRKLIGNMVTMGCTIQ